MHLWFIVCVCSMRAGMQGHTPSVADAVQKLLAIAGAVAFRSSSTRAKTGPFDAQVDEAITAILGVEPRKTIDEVDDNTDD